MFNISEAYKRISSMETLQLELSKCDLVCANCHRKRTWMRGRESNSVLEIMSLK